LAVAAAARATDARDRTASFATLTETFERTLSEPEGSRKLDYLPKTVVTEAGCSGGIRIQPVERRRQRSPETTAVAKFRLFDENVRPALPDVDHDP